MGNACCGAGGQVGPAAKQIFLLMVGLDNAGKTCTAKSIVGESLECVAPTVGFSKVQHKYKVSNILFLVVQQLYRPVSVFIFLCVHKSHRQTHKLN